MVIGLPISPFSRLIRQALPEQKESLFSFLPSGLLAKQLAEGKLTAAFLPSMDLLAHKDLLASRQIGISYEGALCTAYFYYSPNQQEIKKVHLYGDISSNEAILSKILIKEMYDTEVEIAISPMVPGEDKHTLLAGEGNFEDSRFMKGIGFSEEFVDALGLPYVANLLAARSETDLGNAVSLFNGIADKVYNLVDSGKIGINGQDELQDYFVENIAHVIFEFEEQDIESATQMLRMPFYHGLLEDVTEINFR